MMILMMILMKKRKKNKNLKLKEKLVPNKHQKEKIYIKK